MRKESKKLLSVTAISLVIAGVASTAKAGEDRSESVMPPVQGSPRGGSPARKTSLKPWKPPSKRAAGGASGTSTIASADGIVNNSPGGQAEGGSAKAKTSLKPWTPPSQVAAPAGDQRAAQQRGDPPPPAAKVEEPARKPLAAWQSSRGGKAGAGKAAKVEELEGVKGELKAAQAAARDAQDVRDELKGWQEAFAPLGETLTEHTNLEFRDIGSMLSFANAVIEQLLGGVNVGDDVLDAAELFEHIQADILDPGAGVTLKAAPDEAPGEAPDDAASGAATSGAEEESDEEEKKE